jgi:hypothetical protein
MIINVTKKDIENGRLLYCAACPIARAARRRLNERVEVHAGHIWGKGFRHRLPAKARKFIRDFDAGHPVKPMRFEI